MVDPRQLAASSPPRGIRPSLLRYVPSTTRQTWLTTAITRPQGWNLAEVAYTAGHPEGNKSEWVMPAFGSWPAAVALSGSLHVIFSALLGYRVVSVARTAMGKRPAVGSVVVEAAVPYSVVSIIFMSVYCAGIAAANVFGSMVVQFQVRVSRLGVLQVGGARLTLRAGILQGITVRPDHYPHDEGRAR